MNRGCVSLTVDCGDLPGASADAAEAPTAPTESGIRKLTLARVAGAPPSFNALDRL
jgi:hypothetical protein